MCACSLPEDSCRSLLCVHGRQVEAVQKDAVMRTVPPKVLALGVQKVLRKEVWRAQLSFVRAVLCAQSLIFTVHHKMELVSIVEELDLIL